jgi:hypothetical protein
MRKLLAVVCRSSRVAAAAGAAALLSVLGAAPVTAQTLNPNVVEFVPPPEHWATLSSGQPVVSRYDLIFYQQGAIDGFMVTSLGKPTPQADGMIRVDLGGRRTF